MENSKTYEIYFIEESILDINLNQILPKIYQVRIPFTQISTFKIRSRKTSFTFSNIANLLRRNIFKKKEKEKK